MLREDGAIARASLSKKLGISEKAIYVNIKKLKELGKIIRVGSDKHEKWKVSEG